MTIKETELGFTASHSIHWKDEEGKDCILENWQLTASTLEEAEMEASKYMEVHGIDEKISYDLPE